MAYQLGIDLGTTFTAAAVVRAAGAPPEVVTLGTRNATIPSVLFIDTHGGVLVGESAERRAVTDADRVVREFKRRIGDPTPLVVGGRPWPAEELSARLVRWVVDRAAEREGGSAARIALTHPAAWGRHKLDLLGRALAGQGLQVSFLPEPSAAAVAYAANQRVEPSSTIAVYDLGGGTFDAAVVRKTGDARFELLGRPEGIERLGGIDFDQAVFDHVRTGVPGVFDTLDESDPEVLAAVARVRRECTDAKEALSSDTETNIPVLLPGAPASVRLHRSEFEAMIGGQIVETVSALRRAVTSAGLAPDALTAVLLVGGSSRIPLVSQLVSDQLGRPVAVDTDPKNAIAKGAALAVSPQPSAAARPVRPGARPTVGAVAGPAGDAVAGAAGLAGGGRRGGSVDTGGHAGAPFGRAPDRPGRAGGPPAPAEVPGRAPGEPGAAPTGPPRSPRVPLAGGFAGEAGSSYPDPPGPAGPPQRSGEPPRRPLGLLIGLGALAVLVVVIVTLLASRSEDPAPAGGSSTTTTAAEQPGSPRTAPGRDSGSGAGAGATPARPGTSGGSSAGPSPSPTPTPTPTQTPTPTPTPSASATETPSSSPDDEGSTTTVTPTT